jgi:hypothetical protein
MVSAPLEINVKSEQWELMTLFDQSVDQLLVILVVRSFFDFSILQVFTAMTHLWKGS